jgi:hypothetical protein
MRSTENDVLLKSDESGHVNLTVHLLLVLCVFIVTLALVRPGFVDLVTPFHADLYRYFLISQERWLATDWLAPRAVMLAGLRLLGVTGTPEPLFLALSLLPPLFVGALLYLLSRATGLKSASATVIALSVVFASPHFLSIAQLDFGGFLSGLLIASAAFLYIARVTSGQPLSIYDWAALCVLLALAIESKWTFVAAVPVLLLSFWLATKRRDSTVLLAIFVALVSASFAKDWLLKSPFFRAPSAGDVYSLSIAPIRNVEALVFYLRQSVTAPLALGLVIAVAICVSARRHRVALTLLAAGVAAVLPMAAIPNRTMEMYAWFATVFVGLVIWLAVASATSLKQRFGVLVVLVSVILHGYGKAVPTEWNVGNQDYSRKLVNSLRELKVPEGRPWLVAGVRGPYHPLRNTAYAESQFPALRRSALVLVESERAWNAEPSSDLRNGVYVSGVAIDAYVGVVLILPNGGSGGLLPTDVLKAHERAFVDAVLVCPAAGLLSASSSLGEVSETVRCLAESGEGRVASELAAQYPNRKEMPWIDFFVGKALWSMKDRAGAEKALLAAQTADPSNLVFAAALSEVQRAP